MKYLAILGRQPEISFAELSALFPNVRHISRHLATFTGSAPLIDRLGGTLKLAAQLDVSPIDYLTSLPSGKLTVAVSDYSARATTRSATTTALKFKNILTRHGRSVRVVTSKDPVLTSATSLHNGLSGHNPRKTEFIKLDNTWYRVIGVQDIDAYTRRDRTRPARDARVGMLPPKLAQILINLCGPLPAGSRFLDPFCGTGVVLQEALLMGYHVIGSDLSPRMVEYTTTNLTWLQNTHPNLHLPAPELQVGNAVSAVWPHPVDAVACETYLGRPMSRIPSPIALKTEQQECSSIILGFLKNLSTQIASNTPVVLAAPAWLTSSGTYSRLNILDFVEQLGYNVNKTSRDGLIYHRDDQIVARDIIILRKS